LGLLALGGFFDLVKVDALELVGHLAHLLCELSFKATHVCAEFVLKTQDLLLQFGQLFGLGTLHTLSETLELVGMLLSHPLGHAPEVFSLLSCLLLH